jgi:hypothetical protein
VENIKKIITALGTNELNEKLRELEDVEVIGNDIPYQEGLLQMIEKPETDIDIIIVSESLPRRI